MPRKLFSVAVLLSVLTSTNAQADTQAVTYQALPDLRIATFNLSLYDRAPGALVRRLATGKDPVARHAASVIQVVRPDILLLNEIDFDRDGRALRVFLDQYLAVDQGHELAAIEFEYSFVAEPNTGLPSGEDLDGDGEAKDTLGDALGYGTYPGQYGMALLSRYPIAYHQVRTFQHFLWRDLPDAQLPTATDGKSPWYNEAAQAILPLSSKSHWDVPIDIGDYRLHMLASHPTPPAFDGAEKRNAKRNHDEIRFWSLYLDNDKALVDDLGKAGGLPTPTRFVILGDLNASDYEGDSLPGTMAQLLEHPQVNPKPTPESRGGVDNAPEHPHSATHTAVWRKRVDYVLPSHWGFKVLESRVFWPGVGQAHEVLFEDADSASDHRLVYIDVQLVKEE